MSAHTLSNKNFDFLLTVLMLHGGSDYIHLADEYLKIKCGNYYYDKECLENLTKIGSALIKQNYDSVDFRYKEKTEILPYYEFKEMDVSNIKNPIIGALAVLDCYEYQACETPGYHKSDIFEFCSMVRKRLVSALPGYDEAPWGL